MSILSGSYDGVEIAIHGFSRGDGRRCENRKVLMDNTDIQIHDELFNQEKSIMEGMSNIYPPVVMPRLVADRRLTCPSAGHPM